MLIQTLTHPEDGSLHEPLFESKDRFGAISIHHMGNIFITQFSGPCGKTIVKRYTEALDKLANEFQTGAWGYLSISDGFEAATTEAIHELAKSFYRAQKLGCIADAYVIASAMGRAQIKTMRDEFPLPTTFSEVNFDNFNDAFAYLTQALS